MAARTKLLATGAALLLSMAAHASPKKATPAGEDAPAGGQRIHCLSGWERFLPGDYYACRARYHLQRNHPAQAIEMLKEAAYWANKDAQHALGLAYVEGDIPGIDSNRPLGIAWLALAAERKNPQYVRDYSAVALASTSGDLSSADQLFAQLRKTFGDRVAGKRAIQRFVREVKPLDDAASQGGNIAFVSGLTPLPEGAFALSLRVHQHAAKAFEGLQGSVTVGEMQRVEAPTPALQGKYMQAVPAGDKHR